MKFSGCLTMERLLNQYDIEYMKMAMLKHEETFRDQVYELHRLYRVQKMLMKDIARNPQMDSRHCRIRNPESRASLEESGGKCRVNSEMEYDDGDLELTLGPYQKKIKAADPGIQSDNSGRSFSSSSTGSSHMKGGRSTLKEEEVLRRQKWAAETPLSSRDGPPWLFQALSLNMT